MLPSTSSLSPVNFIRLREISHFFLRRNGTLDVVLVLVGAIKIFEKVFLGKKHKTKDVGLYWRCNFKIIFVSL